jgi:hypothetical protein
MSDYLESELSHKWDKWLMLMHYFRHQLEEDEITEATYKSMSEALCMFKPNIIISQEKE